MQEGIAKHPLAPFVVNGVKVLKLRNKVVVITGAARGIGNCIARTMAREGARTCILDFDERAGGDARQFLCQSGAEALFVKTDVADYQSVLNAKKEIISVYGRVDILVVNAGVSIKHSISEISAEEWQRVIDINLNGSFYTCKAFYDEFSSKSSADDGRIIFISSGSGITGTGGGAHYAASKSGQHGLMRALSKELGKNGVNVNAIAPRVIVTDIFDMLYPTEEEKQLLLSKIPIGRFGYPEDIAEFALFLCGPEASYIHGQIILLDGGRTF